MLFGRGKSRAVIAGAALGMVLGFSGSAFATASASETTSVAASRTSGGGAVRGGGGGAVRGGGVGGHPPGGGGHPPGGGGHPPGGGVVGTGHVGTGHGVSVGTAHGVGVGTGHGVGVGTGHGTGVGTGHGVVGGHGGIHTGTAVFHTNPAHVTVHTTPSHWGGANWHANWGHAYTLHSTFVHTHVALVNNIHVWGNSWHTAHWAAFQTRYNRWHYFGQDYFRFYYSGWFRFGWYGGFWYPVRPCWTIETYFEYPLVNWFYATTWTPDYWNAYYSETEPQGCSDRFPYAGIYFPTDSLRDMLVEVSGMEMDRRCNFRTGVILMTNSIRDQLSAQTGVAFTFNTNDVVINHYDNLQNQALSVAGIVDNGTIQIPFQGVIDLLDASRTVVIVAGGQNPTGDEVNQVQSMNQKVTALGGDPLTAAQEPLTAPADPPPPTGNE